MKWRTQEVDDMAVAKRMVAGLVAAIVVVGLVAGCAVVDALLDQGLKLSGSLSSSPASPPVPEHENSLGNARQICRSVPNTETE